IDVPEWSAVPIRVDVRDDVQVRNVEVLVNGTVVSNDVSFPFDFVETAPMPTAEHPQMTIQVRATDTWGNVTLSNALVLPLVRDTVAPSILAVSPEDGASTLAGVRVVRVQFSETIDPNTLNAGTVR